MAFVGRTPWAGWDVEPLAGDASTRRYFRLRRARKSVVLMDAPPESGQNVGRFLDVARVLEEAGLSVPRALAEDRGAGFAIVEDFGDVTFARLVAERPDMEASLYGTATDVLVELDGHTVPDLAPVFGAKAMAAGTKPAYEWYAGGIRATRTAGFHRIETELEAALSAAAREPPTLSLRDFHSENLIWLPDRRGIRRAGLLDFQDAMAAPPGYDLVSMLLDARRDVSPDVASTAKKRFAEATGRDPVALETAFATIGLQRNLRILGVFARLAIEGGKPHYIDFIPRVWRHVMACLSHPSLSRIAETVTEDLPEPTPENLRKLKERCSRSHH